MANVQTVKDRAKNTQVASVFDFIKANKNLIGKALPNVFTPERFLSQMTMIMKSSPALMQCTQESLIGAVVSIAQLGLNPSPDLGHVYLVPYNNNRKVNGTWVKVLEVQKIIGYQGYVALINNSGNATVLGAEVVYSKDKFEYEQGLNPKLVHVPAVGDRGEKVGVYCIAKNMLANEKVFRFLNAEEVEKVKAESLSKVPENKMQYSPWVKWEDAMWLKTSVRAIRKLLPLSLDVQKQLSSDDTIKTEIAEDMTEVKDEANWDNVEDAEVKEEPKETTPEEPTDAELAELEAAEEMPTVDDAKNMLCSGAKEARWEEPLSALTIGATRLEICLDVVAVKVFPKSDKMKSGKTTFCVKEEDGTQYFISRWGVSDPEKYTGHICTFFEVRRGDDYKGKPQFMAKEVKAGA